jgi:hypothetical protein
MFKTVDDKVRERRKIRESYTFQRCGHIDREDRVLSPRQRQSQTIPILTIHTDTDRMVRKLQHTVVLQRPRMDQAEVRRELQASSARIQHIRAGAPISTVSRQPYTIYPLQEPHLVDFIDEREATRPPRHYVVPQVPRPSEYVFASGDVGPDPIDIAENEFNKMRNRIAEDDRAANNRLLTELNRRNKRRHEAIGTQYEDLIKYGMTEANRRARRAAKLSELKEARTDSWWSGFVDEFPQVGKSVTDLIYLEMLAKVPEFNELTFGAIYRDALMRFKDGRNFKEVLTRVNELSGAIQQYKLLMIYKDIENRVKIENMAMGMR